MGKQCKHPTVIITWNPETGDELARRCSPTFGCGEQLALGTSNDSPAEVKMEIRAAELEAGDWPTRTVGERWGWEAHESGGDTEDDIELAGWLHREMVTHEAREARDVFAWRWTSTLEISGQYEGLTAARQGAGVFRSMLEEDARIKHGAPEAIGLTPLQHREQVAAGVAAEDALRDPAVTARNAEVIAAQTRHDVAASVARHAKLVDFDPAPNIEDADPAEVDSLLAAVGVTRFDVLVGTDPSDTDPPPVRLDPAYEAERAAEPDSRDE